MIVQPHAPCSNSKGKLFRVPFRCLGFLARLWTITGGPEHVRSSVVPRATRVESDCAQARSPSRLSTVLVVSTVAHGRPMVAALRAGRSVAVLRAGLGTAYASLVGATSRVGAVLVGKPVAARPKEPAVVAIADPAVALPEANDVLGTASQASPA